MSVDTLAEAVTAFRTWGRCPKFSTTSSDSYDTWSDTEIAGHLRTVHSTLAREIALTTRGFWIGTDLGWFRRARTLTPISATEQIVLPDDIANVIGFKSNSDLEDYLWKQGDADGESLGEFRPAGFNYAELLSTYNSLIFVYNSNLWRSLISGTVSSSTTEADGRASFIASATLSYGDALVQQDDWYNCLRVKFTSGDQQYQQYFITDYDYATRKFTLDKGWVGTAPAAADTFGTVSDLPAPDGRELWVYEALSCIASVPEDRRRRHGMLTMQYLGHARGASGGQ